MGPIDQKRLKVRKCGNEFVVSIAMRREDDIYKADRVERSAPATYLAESQF